MARKTKAEAELTRLQILEAARQIFHSCGVSRTSLEKVAQAAGVTRGAVYWHFANKAELFFAVREEYTQEINEADKYLLSPDIPDPLDSIMESVFEFFRILRTSPKAKETMEIMTLRCEYVEEFAPVLQVVNEPCADFKCKLIQTYRRAAEMGVLADGLAPEDMAQDTLAFVTGLFNQWISASPEEAEAIDIPRRVSVHMNLRRRPAAPIKGD